MTDQGDMAWLAELAAPLRRRIYDHVASRRGPVSKDEAALALGIGRSLAAYHLDRLLSAGLLTASYARTSGRTGPGAGRTAKLYTVSTREFHAAEPARDYENIGRLLASAVDRDTSGDSQRRAEQTAYEAGVAAGRDAGGAKHIVELLRGHGYSPFQDGQTIRLGNCPFHHLAQDHRDLVCAVNHALVRGMVDGLGAAQTTALLDPRPGHCCVALAPAGTPT